MSKAGKRFLLCVVMWATLWVTPSAQAQYNREYFFWVGQRCMMDSNYQEAIRVLNTLLRFDE